MAAVAALLGMADSSVAGTVETCTNLVQGVWSCATNMTSTGGVMSVVLHEPTARVKMYRILGEVDY